MELIKTNQIETRLPNGDMSGIKLRECNWSVKTAGPSPYENNRVELFLLGCNKAMSGNPCKGCFNSTTWDASKAMWTHDPVLMAQHINNNAKHKYITIGGGEPTDQIDNVIILCKELKKYDFHIMIYTWRDLKHLLRFNKLNANLDENDEEFILCGKMNTLLNYVDIVVDGEYKEEERLWDGTKEDGLISSVGSGNQIIWDIHKKIGFAMRDLESIWLSPTNRFMCLVKDLNCKSNHIKF